MIIFLVMLTFSCGTSIETEKEKVMELEINPDLEKFLKTDLNCFRNNYLEIFKERPFFDIYAEKVEDEYEIHISTSKILEVDKNCHGYFYIDTVIFTVYGEFVPDLYKNKNLKILKVNNSNVNDKRQKNNLLVNEEIVSWHYKYKNGKLSYLIENTCHLR